MNPKKEIEVLKRKGLSVKELFKQIEQSIKKRLDDLSSHLEHFTQKVDTEFSAESSEKFNLLLAESHSIRVYFNYLEKEMQLEKYLKENPGPLADQDFIQSLIGQINMHKILWGKMNKQIVDGHARVADRSARLKEPDKIEFISLTQIHKYEKDAMKALEDKNKE